MSIANTMYLLNALIILNIVLHAVPFSISLLISE